ncbi:hypothetical protein R3P38DRAFT_3196905 [Favolaschia claudopus]|uniref:F-box domain-containing protein n=1 Tax=Favolaschia claudopus TaxID=2862362 RepID=A0AAW0B6N7_9AGAR
MPTINDKLSRDVLEEILDIALLANTIENTAATRQQTSDTCGKWRDIIKDTPRYWRKVFVGRRTQPDFLDWQFSQSSGGPMQIEIQGRDIPRTHWHASTEPMRGAPDIETMANKLERCLVPEFHRVATLTVEAEHIADWIALVKNTSHVEFTIGTKNPIRMTLADLAAISRGTQIPWIPTLPGSKWHNIQSLKIKDLIPISGEWNAHANLTKLEIKGAHTPKRLRELVLEDVIFMTDSEAWERPRITDITLHSVERLKFMNWGNQTWSILQHLRMPALKVLSLTLMGPETFGAVAPTCGHLLNTVQYLELKFIGTPADGEATIWKGLCDVKTIDISQSMLETWDSLERYMANQGDVWPELEEIRLRRCLTKRQASKILLAEHMRGKRVIAWMTEEEDETPFAEGDDDFRDEAEPSRRHDEKSGRDLARNELT